MFLEIQSSEMGMNKVFDNGEWIIGIKNYKSQSSYESFSKLERHMLTDEIFVPLTDRNIMVYTDKIDFCTDDLKYCLMLKGNIYCISKKMWHNVVMTEQDKLILVERPDTSDKTSEEKKLTKEQIEKVKEMISSAVEKMVGI